MQHHQPPVGILGLGTFVPERVMTNADLEKIVDTTDEWILTRTGIRERRICSAEESTSVLAIGAARAALVSAGLDVGDLGLIIVCSMTPEFISPSTACLVHRALGAPTTCAAFDLSAACSGFVYGLSVAASMIRGGAIRRALVIGADAMSKVMNYHDRTTCVLFGDGAGAVVLGPVEPGRGLLGQALGADGTGSDHIVVPVPGIHQPLTEKYIADEARCMRMAGNEVYKFATRICGQALEEAIANIGNGLRIQDLEVIVPHQANVRIIEAAAKKLGIPAERFVINIDRYGNTSGATIPLALADARAAGRLKPGTLLGMVAFGGGLTYGASVWRW